MTVNSEPFRPGRRQLIKTQPSVSEINDKLHAERKHYEAHKPNPLLEGDPRTDKPTKRIEVLSIL